MAAEGAVDVSMTPQTAGIEGPGFDEEQQWAAAEQMDMPMEQPRNTVVTHQDTGLPLGYSVSPEYVDGYDEAQPMHSEESQNTAITPMKSKKAGSLKKSSTLDSFGSRASSRLSRTPEEEAAILYQKELKKQRMKYARSLALVVSVVNVIYCFIMFIGLDDYHLVFRTSFTVLFILDLWSQKFLENRVDKCAMAIVLAAALSSVYSARNEADAQGVYYLTCLKVIVDARRLYLVCIPDVLSEEPPRKRLSTRSNSLQSNDSRRSSKTSDSGASVGSRDSAHQKQARSSKMSGSRRPSQASTAATDTGSQAEGALDTMV